MGSILGYASEADDILRIRLFMDILRAKKGNFICSAKLVRGAYLKLERERATHLGKLLEYITVQLLGMI